MLEKIKQFLAKAKVQGLLVAVGVLSAGLGLLSFVLSTKNKTIKDLRTELACKNAKLNFERVRIKHQVTAEEIKKLREEDACVRKELSAIEVQLTEKLSPDMTAEEIAAKFREIGI